MIANYDGAYLSMTILAASRGLIFVRENLADKENMSGNFICH